MGYHDRNLHSRHAAFIAARTDEIFAAGAERRAADAALLQARATCARPGYHKDALNNLDRIFATQKAVRETRQPEWDRYLDTLTGLPALDVDRLAPSPGAIDGRRPLADRTRDVCRPFKRSTRA